MRAALIFLVVSAAVALLAVGWGAYHVLDQTERVANQGRLMLGSIRGTTLEVHRMAQEAVVAQREAFGELNRLSTAVAGAITGTTAATCRTLDRLAARLERMADTLEGGGSEVLCEAAETIRGARREIVPRIAAVLDGAREGVAGVRPLLDEARVGLNGVTGELCNATAGVRPVLDATAGLVTTTDAIAGQVAEIAKDGADVAQHYKQMILHPSTGQRIKGWLQLFFSGLTVWANTKTIF